MQVIRELSLLDELLGAHAAALGRDRDAYRNHAYRVLNWCAALLHEAPVPHEKVAIAAAFHDLGIWTAHTFDYLPPSVQLARDYLAGSARAGWSEEIEQVIFQHHKLFPYRAEPRGLTEAFRRADWVDLTFGWSRQGLDRGFMREVWATFPRAGFHGRLVTFACQRFVRHPLRPLPMLRW